MSIHTNKQDSSEWYAIDGKELRGSINLNSKDTRGLSIVYALSHLSNQQQLLGYYDGTKESEKEVVKESITKMLNAAKISLDAMHNSAGLLSDIEQSDRFYLTQIKGNQKHLKEDLIHTSEHLVADNMLSEIDKSHGRIDQRDYEIYAINTEMLQPRWSESGICNMVKVTRSSCTLKTDKNRKEIRYYITNYNGDIAEIAGAIRNHWKIEVMNRIRDVNFGEDNFKSLNHGIQKSMAAIMLFICSGLMKINEDDNLNKLRDELVYSPYKINKFFAA
ncbi:ISAs1 family transposase [Halosquirtibacter xylanolyticus]|uniref:ISAs1 family transposase n=1 Tax=Halosquirtibacter xylanolyticus TaxID=3374599 RepID=UPI003748F6C7|nr:ISAs1 family transposase [Prolixibacteraceae bacterium]